MLVEPAQSEPPGFDCTPTLEIQSQAESEASSPVDVNQFMNMATVTIKLDGESAEDASFLNPDGHVSRRDSATRRSVRRNRALSAVEGMDQSETVPTITRNIRKLNSLDNVLKWFQGASKNSTKKSKEYEPGLRSMLYGLHQKMEREEAALKKLQKKEKGQSFNNFLFFS